MRNEVLLALVVTAAFVFWYYFGDGVVVVNRVLAQNRGQVYGTLASILASLLGFVIAAVTILLTLWPMKALKLLKDSAHADRCGCS